MNSFVRLSPRKGSSQVLTIAVFAAQVRKANGTQQTASGARSCSLVTINTQTHAEVERDTVTEVLTENSVYFSSWGAQRPGRWDRVFSSCSMKV
ncbi:hypothetical protein Forpi1262_v013601 [Fusarium oxysporum f. sp. raphani]|uniref:Uncharacterized protein n=1 Tax=Fusarium oxysporum f. sp. raphani TaxID=96318 RepID=A0A8J5PKH6_FUSOX|nr:hypothetical protein Forpi1262_v013601 [Fusarium oxysporum f. sp. raphani]